MLWKILRFAAQMLSVTREIVSMRQLLHKADVFPLHSNIDFLWLLFMTEFEAVLLKHKAFYLRQNDRLIKF